MNSVPKPEKKKKKVKKKGKSPKLVLDKIWSELIKKKAGYKSELSGATGILNSHHISGKKTLLLRYSLMSGICVTAGEHIWKIHNADYAEEYRRKIIHVRFPEIFDNLEILKNHGEMITYEDAKEYFDYSDNVISGKLPGNKLFMIVKAGWGYQDYLKNGKTV